MHGWLWATAAGHHHPGADPDDLFSCVPLRSQMGRERQHLSLPGCLNDIRLGTVPIGQNVLTVASKTTVAQGNTGSCA